MGLDIHTNMGSVYMIGYSGIHYIRYLAVQTKGYEGRDYSTYFDSKIGKDYCNELHDLLHHSDCEGVYIPQYYLIGVDYKRSSFLGNSTEFKRLLNDVFIEVCKNKSEYDIPCGDPLISKMAELLEMLNDEDWDGFIYFK